MVDILTAALCVHARHPAKADAPLTRAMALRAVVGVLMLVTVFGSLSGAKGTAQAQLASIARTDAGPKGALAQQSLVGVKAGDGTRQPK